MKRLINLEEFPTSETGKELLESVTKGWYDRSYVGKWLFQVMGLFLDEIRQRYEELPSQFFVETATWGLAYHEQKYGLPVREDLEYEKRRRLISEKRGARPPATPYAMERLVDNATGFPVYVADINDPVFPQVCAVLNQEKGPNEFFVVLLGEGTADVKGIRRNLDRMKQSHTSYDMTYYEQCQYQAPVTYGNVVHFLLTFYPRFNQAYLYLDGIWKLDRSQVLNGYDNGTLLDFYPVGLRFRSGAGADMRVGEQFHIPLWFREVVDCGVYAGKYRIETREDVEDAERIWFQTATQETAGEEERLEVRTGICNPALLKCVLHQGIRIREQTGHTERAGIRTGAAQEVKTETIRILVRNQMDQTWQLNGRRKLNGGLSVL